MGSPTTLVRVEGRGEKERDGVGWHGELETTGPEFVAGSRAGDQGDVDLDAPAPSTSPRAVPWGARRR